MDISRRSLFNKAAATITSVGSALAVVDCAPKEVALQTGRLNPIQREAMKQVIAQQAMLEALVLDTYPALDVSKPPTSILEAVRESRKHVQRVVRESLERTDSRIAGFVDVMIPRAPRIMADAVISSERSLAESKETAIDLVECQAVPADYL